MATPICPSLMKKSSTGPSLSKSSANHGEPIPITAANFTFIQSVVSEVMLLSFGNRFGFCGNSHKQADTCLFPYELCPTDIYTLW